MSQLVRPLLLVLLILLLPIVPFLLLGDGFEAQLHRWLGSQVTRQEMCWAVLALHTVDMLLPVPSSLVSTLSGARLGIALGTAVSWAGMSVGATLGYGLARVFGEPLARRFTRGDDWRQMQHLTNQYGQAALAITRPVPILAEATVFLLGTTHLTWMRFLPVMLLSNLAIALAYAVLGRFSFEHGQLAIALAASVALPLLATILARKFFAKRMHADEVTP